MIWKKPSLSSIRTHNRKRRADAKGKNISQWTNTRRKGSQAILTEKMAAVVAGLARLFQPALAFSGGDTGCQGLAPWYLLLGLRLVALFIADGPWSSASPDLACNWTLVAVDIRPFCSALCFNQRFSAPISSAWGFAFLVALLPVGLMRLIKTGHKHQRNAAVNADEGQADPSGVHHTLTARFNEITGENSPASMATSRIDMIPLERKTALHCTWRAVAFSFCVILLLASELCFLWVVISLQIPPVSETTFLCYPGSQTCPKALECVLAGQPDKQMALWILALTAFVNMAACLAYLLLKLGKVFRCQRR
ncbi:uncharacterized protein [Tiliqua scincoides]|uniref:uncharacterized protein n=1 Tax=Tiliqua scincoides TaxID=71010 RepID=UPI003461C1FB